MARNIYDRPIRGIRAAGLRDVTHPAFSWLVLTAVAVGAAFFSIVSAAAEQATTPAVGGERPRIGLVLSGGGARGAAHIGVLRVLEELRVPITCIAGTSMGSIVGAAYSSGTSVQEMQATVARMSAETLFREQPPRFEQSMRRKADDHINYIGPEIGIRDNKVQLPKGLVSGVQLESVLRQLSKTKGYYDFDRLPIPFRAVATDIVTGEAVVLHSGELASAMRASMSVPGAFAPARIGGRTLLDGGLVRNLPVDVARDLCADVVIAVNLGSPLLKEDEVGSILGVTQQMVNILTEQNVQKSLSELRPGDVLLTPNLEGFSSSDFDKLPAIVARGEEVARTARDQLARFSIPQQEYQRLRQHQSAPPTPVAESADAVRVENLRRVNPQTVLAMMDTKKGDSLEADRIDHDMQRIYGSGDFEHVGYRVMQDAAQNVLAVEAIEKAWGPDYLRFGLNLSSDFSGDAFFNLLGSYRQTWINSLGAEWRTDAQVGRNSLLVSEFYQPLDVRSLFFVAPRVDAGREPIDLFLDGDRIARYDVKSAHAGLDFGVQVTRWGEARIGILRGALNAELDTGPASLAPTAADRVQQGAITAQLRFDQLDSITLPRRGFAANAYFYSSEADLGADETYAKWDADFVGAYSFGEHTVQLGLQGSGSISGTRPRYDQAYLGGFLHLSGLRTFELYGDEMRLGRLVYQHRLLRQTLMEGMYIGISLEAGQVRDPVVTGNRTDVLTGGSIFLAMDTLLGPVYLAYGVAEGDRESVYFLLGRY
jgi:NTE family protein